MISSASEAIYAITNALRDPENDFDQDEEDILKEASGLLHDYIPEDEQNAVIGK